MKLATLRNPHRDGTLVVVRVLAPTPMRRPQPYQEMTIRP
jgi:hypothetical protein